MESIGQSRGWAVVGQPMHHCIDNAGLNWRNPQYQNNFNSYQSGGFCYWWDRCDALSERGNDFAPEISLSPVGIGTDTYNFFPNNYTITPGGSGWIGPESDNHTWTYVKSAKNPNNGAPCAESDTNGNTVNGGGFEGTLTDTAYAIIGVNIEEASQNLFKVLNFINEELKTNTNLEQKNLRKIKTEKIYLKTTRSRQPLELKL